MAAVTTSFLVALASLVTCEGKALWSSSPATYGPQEDDGYILKTGYPVGNGKLGAIPFGTPGAEKINLNVDSLWFGGPFEVENYSGGNPPSPIYEALPEIRTEIFEAGTGDLSPLLGNGTAFGSNRVLGNLTVEFEGVDTYTEYRRQLDLSTGVHTTTFNAGGNSTEYEISVFCSYPDQVCVYGLKSTESLPDITLGFENTLVDQGLLTWSCEKGAARFSGVTQSGPPEGMKYAAVARVDASSASTQCLENGSVTLTPLGNQVSVIISAETNYNQKKGNAESNWSFKGEDPEPVIEEISAAASKKQYEELLSSHIEDYGELQGAFSLELPDPNGSEDTETAELFANYAYDSAGDPFLENLLFDLARHLLITSSRDNSLPANLQGRWTEQIESAWGADYHSNINIQMNYWPADQTGLSSTQRALFSYIEDTWVPRGSETARLLYNASGWVVHNEMNTFGFTAMKDNAVWANYAAAGAWMMQHVWDTFDYTRDQEWFQTQGYPLIKGVAEFWLSSLQEDAFFEDGSLVVNPCNSAEHGPTTFGCVHFQQLIHQVFDSILAAQNYISDDDKDFVNAVSSSLQRLDTGLHFTSWGGIKEWKIPDSYGYDNKSDHRHLSHLNGWHPGYSISSFANGYTNATIQGAVRESLIARGMGNAPDANAGWAKVWRAACWARLNDTDKAHQHLRYAIDENFAANGLSMYSGTQPPFQIDANFGLAGAVLSMLVVDLPPPHGDGSRDRTVVLGPAIPKAWGNGKVKGLRLRGGGIVDFDWDENGIVDQVHIVSEGNAAEKAFIVNVEGKPLAEVGKGL